MMKHGQAKNDFTLAPPQIIELGRLLNFTDAEQLKHFSFKSSGLRADRIFPVICFCDDGAVFLYPGMQLNGKILLKYLEISQMNFCDTAMSITH